MKRTMLGVVAFLPFLAWADPAPFVRRGQVRAIPGRRDADHAGGAALELHNGNELRP